MFNARYVIAPTHLPLPGALRRILITRKYTLFEAPTTGYASFVALAEAVRPRSQSELLGLNRSWLASADPPLGRHLLISFLEARQIPTPAAGCASPTYLREQIQPSRLEFTVSCPTEASLAVKVTYHPNWRVTVDGSIRPTFMVSPSYLAVAEYVPASSKTPLLLFALAVLVGTVAFRRRLDLLVP